jgi:carboxypeptidase family protein
MTRSFALALAVLSFSLTAAVSAQPIVVTGMVTDHDAKPIPGTRVTVYPYESPYAAARALFEGQEPSPLAQATADAAGRFRLTLREVDFYSVEVSAPGFLTLYRELAPLVSDLELEPAELEAATEVVVRVQNPDGSPREGAWVTATEASTSRGWKPRRRERTAADGTARLSRGSDETPRWLAAAPGFLEASAAARGAVTLRLLANGSRQLRVLDAQGRPAADVVAVAGDGSSPLSISGPTGTLEVPARCDKLRLIPSAGPGVDRRLPVLTTAAQPLLIQLPAGGSVEGRVVDLTTRRPIPDALVWSSRRPETRVRTRGDGSYLFSTLEPGPSGLRAAARGYVGGFGGAATPAAGEVGRGPTVALAPSRGLGGIVVDEQGRGVAGARLTAQTDRRRMGRDVMMLGLMGGRVRATSGAEGRFSFAALVAGQPYVLVAQAEGYAPAQFPVRVPADSASAGEARIVLVKGLRASGLAVDAKRQPVAGASATLSSSPGQRDWMAMGMDSPDPKAAKSDASGRFTFTDLAPGRFDLEVEAPGRSPVDVPGIEIGGDTGADLGTVVLLAEAIVEGVVVEASGKPISGAAIGINGNSQGRGGYAFFDSHGEQRDTETSGDGWFRVGGLRPQRPVSLMVWAQGFSPQTVAGIVPREAPAPPTRVVLQPASRLGGRVLDRLQKPVPGAAVTGMLMREGFESMWRTRIGDEGLVTDEDGRFELRDVPEGMADIRVRANGFQNGTLQVPVSAGKDVLDLELVLQPGAVVAGRVLDAAGEPVVTANVGLGDGSRSVGGARVDGDGAYRLEGVPIERTTVTAFDGGRKVSKAIEVARGENTLDLVFPAGASVSGLVLDGTGQPVADARLFLRGTNAVAAIMDNVVSGADGRFQFDGRRDGEYKLNASKQGLVSREVPVTVAGAPVTGVEIRLERGAALVGQLEGLAFAELPRARVQAHSTQVAAMVEGSADFAGRFRLEGLGAGEWDVTAQITGAGRHAHAHVTVPPDEVEVPVVLRFERGLVLTGAVSRREMPVSGAEVALSGQGVGGGGSVVTDLDGRFKIEDLERGSYVLAVAMGGKPVYRDTIELEEDREVAVELRSGALRGRVVNAVNKEPIARAELRLWQPEVELLDDIPGDTEVRTDSRGLFFFEEVAGGDWRLRASGPGFAAQERDVRIAEDGSVSEIELVLQPTEGLMLDLTLDGQPLASGWALVLDAAGVAVWDGHFFGDESGRASFTSVPPGTVTVWVMGLESAPASLSAAVPGPPVKVALRRGGELDVRVPELYDDAATAKLVLVDGDGQRLVVPGGRVLTQEFDVYAGRTSVRHLHAGPWTLTARAADGRVWTGTTIIPPTGGETEVELRRE